MACVTDAQSFVIDDNGHAPQYLCQTFVLAIGIYIPKGK